MRNTAFDLSSALEAVYSRYNRREFVHSDPVEFLYSYDDIADREIVGLVASSLAYGRVSLILKKVRMVLNILGSSPSLFLAETDKEFLRISLSGFRHRFTSGDEIAAVLHAASALQYEFGLLGNCFESLSVNSSYAETQDRFVSAFLEKSGLTKCSMLPRPHLGSACKRLNLFLRWMVRCDEVDPGGWNGISSGDLIVPLDVHMSRAGRSLGFTKRKSDDMRTALEITGGFRRICPEDPVRYDFAITRFGILGLQSEKLFIDLFST